MDDDEARKENRDNVYVFLDRARDTETGRGRGEETHLTGHLLNESADLRTALLNTGGAIAYALLDLADAIRQHGRT